MMKILAVAINEYEDVSIRNLNNCKSDLELAFTTLRDLYQVEDVEFIYETKDTTRRNLYATLRRYMTDALEDETLMIMFAGHGQYDPYLQASYWQPSDSIYDDPSSWLNIADLLSMLSVSKAKHICIVSDSCFSGAIFEPLKRGGGITAFESRKSRIALTSGGIETVSDGKPGNTSPFISTLVHLLKENTLEELLFTTLAENVILNFKPNSLQTPKSGGLNSVGHEGGSLVLKKRSDKKLISENNQTLNNFQKNLSTISIVYSNDELEIIDHLAEIKAQKNEVISKQQYEKAAEIRDNEKKKLELLHKSINQRVENVYKNAVTKLDGKLGRKIDEIYRKYKYTEMKYEELYEEIKKKGDYKNKEKDIFDSFFVHDDNFIIKLKAESSLIQLMKTDSNIIERRTNPNKILWDKIRPHFMKCLDAGVFELLSCFGRLTGGASNEQIVEKKSALKDIILGLHRLQLNKTYNTKEESFEDIVQRRNLETNLLNWLRDI